MKKIIIELSCDIPDNLAKKLMDTKIHPIGAGSFVLRVPLKKDGKTTGFYSFRHRRTYVLHGIRAKTTKKVLKKK